MGYSITDPQKRLVRDLLKVGRWNNESEIIRYGLHLVAKEVEADQSQGLKPYSASVLKRAYRKLSARDRADEEALSRASAGPGKGELD
jgi:Arc/MetJ-type ribon-helix-helix transcriptional regulator